MTPAEIKSLCAPWWNEFAAKDPVARLWHGDHTLWKPKPTEIANRLAWLELPNSMRDTANEIAHFAEEIRDWGATDVVLLGMGGSSLSAVVIDSVFQAPPGAPRLHVLDTTIPEAAAHVRSIINLDKTLFLVSSKSGATVEVLSLYQYFYNEVKAVTASPGQHFVAITDPGASLEALARETGFRHVFINNPDVGGRYSVLSCFGLVPAALIGVDVIEFLSRGRDMARLCTVQQPIADNPGGWLGFVLGCLARNGRNKITLLTSPRLADFGLWAEQLIAESSGKEGRGIIPIAQEPFAPAECYDSGRVFHCLRMSGEDAPELEKQVRALEQAGFPVLYSELRDPNDLAAEFFKWEFAIALACMVLCVNPFDQPDVEESKKRSKRMLSEGASLAAEGNAAKLISEAGEMNYLALMAFLEQTPETDRAFNDLRKELLNKHHLATTLGYGPRFLHSTGQLHKGGPDTGLFLQITREKDMDVPIPGQPYGLATLAAAQAAGDFEALKARNRKAVRLHLRKEDDLAAALRKVIAH